MAASDGYYVTFTPAVMYGRAAGRGYAAPIPDFATFSLGQAYEASISFGRGLLVGRAEGYGHGEEDGVAEGEAGALPVGIASGIAAAAASNISETAPPFIGTVSPVASADPGTAGAFPADFATARITPIVVPVVDVEVTVAFVVMSALYFDRDTWETVYAGRPAADGNTGFMPGYSAGSGVTGTGDPGVGFVFSVRKDAGWPGRLASNSTIQFRINAVDSNGNVLA